MGARFKAIWEFLRDYAKGIPLDWIIWTKSGHAFVIGLVGMIGSVLVRLFSEAEEWKHDSLVALVAFLFVTLISILWTTKQTPEVRAHSTPDTVPPLRDFVSAVRIDNDGTHLPMLYFRTGAQAARKILTNRKVSKIRFVLPQERTVSENELPADLPVGRGRLIIKRFVTDGILVEEKDTLGDEVEAELYFEVAQLNLWIRNKVFQPPTEHVTGRIFIAVQISNTGPQTSVRLWQAQYERSDGGSNTLTENFFITDKIAPDEIVGENLLHDQRPIGNGEIRRGWLAFNVGNVRTKVDQIRIIKTATVMFVDLFGALIEPSPFPWSER
jgi:hypothetical protein